MPCYAKPCNARERSRRLHLLKVLCPNPCPQCGLLLSIVIVGAGFWYAKRAIRKIEREQEEAKAAAELAAAQHNLMYGEDPPEGGGDEAGAGDKQTGDEAGEAEAGRTAEGCTAGTGTGTGTARCDVMAVLDAKVAAKHLAVWAGEAEGLGVQGIPAVGGAGGGGGALAACDGLPRVRRSTSLKQQLLQEQQEAATAAPGSGGGSGREDRGLGPRSVSAGRRQGQQLSSPCTARVAPAAAGSEAAGWEELKESSSPARPSGGRASYITASGGGSLLQSCSSGSLAAAAAGRAQPPLPPLPPLPPGQALGPLPLGQSPLGQSPSRLSRDSGGDRTMLTSPPLAYKRVAQLRDQATCGSGAAAAAAATAAAATSGGGSSGVSTPASPMYAASGEGSQSARVASVISLGMVGLEEDAFRAALDEDSDPWVGQCDALSSPRDSAGEMVLHANTVGCTAGGGGGAAGQGLVGSVVGSGSCHRSLSALMVRKPSVQAMAGMAGAGGGEEGGGSGGGSGAATPSWRRGGTALEYEHIVVPPSPQRPVRPVSASVGGLAPPPRSNLGMSCGGVLPAAAAAPGVGPVREAAVCYSGNDLPLVDGPLEWDRVAEEGQAVAVSAAACAVGVAADGELPNTPARISLIGAPLSTGSVGSSAGGAAGTAGAGRGAAVVAPSTSGNGRGAGAGRG